MSDESLAKCPACDNLIPPGIDECPYCGAELDSDGALVVADDGLVVAESNPIQVGTVGPIVVDERFDDDSGIITTGRLQDTFANVKLPDHIPARTAYEEPPEFQPFKLTEQLKPSNQGMTVRAVKDVVPVLPEYDPHPSASAHVDSSGLGFGVLSFFIPIVGFILWFMWHRDTPNRARAALIGAVIGTFMLGFGGACGF